MRLGRSLGTVLLLTAAGCASQGRLEIRPSAASAALIDRPAAEHLADARAQLALGNVGLALELFRKAAREQADSAEALSGMAACYDRMGRPDLSRRYLELALAAAPRNPVLLTSLATVAEQQGEAGEAAALRQEAAPAALATGGSVTIALPAADPITPLPVAVPAAPAIRPAAANTLRLERLSPNEVALVTRGKAASFAPLSPARGGDTPVRLLNAARVRGLAATTQGHLARRGWTLVDIGNSPRLRERSLILFAYADAAMARRLSRQLRLPLARTTRPGPIVVLLGRDAAGRPPARKS